VRLIPLPNKTASAVAESFVSGWVASHGVPLSLVTDRGKEFDATVFAAMCRKLGVSHSFSSAGHPQSNASVERMNRTILTYFRKYLEHNSAWSGLLAGLEFAYNTAPHSSTKLSPFLAAFGRRPIVPSSLRVPEVFYGSDHGEQRLAAMASMHERVVGLQQLAFATQKATFDRRSVRRILEKGDIVYVTAPHTGTRFQKFQAPFMGPFTVMRVLGHNNYELWSPHRRSLLRCHINRIKIPPYTAQLGWETPNEQLPAVESATEDDSWHDRLEASLRHGPPSVEEEEEQLDPEPEDVEPDPGPVAVQAGAPPPAPQAPPPPPRPPNASASARAQPVTQRATRAQTERSGRPLPAVPRVMSRALERKEREDKGKPKAKQK
jgi:hypothetical protein